MASLWPHNGQLLAFLEATFLGSPNCGKQKNLNASFMSRFDLGIFSFLRLEFFVQKNNFDRFIITIENIKLL